MDLKTLALVRGSSIGGYSEGTTRQLEMNTRGDLVVAAALPPLAEIVRMGGSWRVATSSGTTALTSAPTTTAGFSLFNGESEGGKSYVIQEFGSWEAVVDATQTDVTAIFSMMNPPEVTPPTAASLTPRSLSGKSNYGGAAVLATGATVTNAIWFSHPTEGAQMAAAAAGAQWKHNAYKPDGLMILRPKAMLSIHAVKAAAAAASQQFFYFVWHEVQMTLG